MEKPLFGTPLGAYKGVVGYSNRKARKFSPQQNYVNGVYTGYQYQCVEYARRWLVTVKNLSFESIHFACSIWDIDRLENVENKDQVKLVRIPNGSPVPPQAESLLIYKRGFGVPWGHVAIIAEVDLEKKLVRVAEQNEDDNYWPGEYAREIPLEVENGRYWIRDKYRLFGWMVYENIPDVPLENKSSCLMF